MIRILGLHRHPEDPPTIFRGRFLFCRNLGDKCGRVKSGANAGACVNAQATCLSRALSMDTATHVNWNSRSHFTTDSCPFAAPAQTSYDDVAERCSRTAQNKRTPKPNTRHCRKTTCTIPTRACPRRCVVSGPPRCRRSDAFSGRRLTTRPAN